MHIPKFIFIEGPDNVGKSTLIDHIKAVSTGLKYGDIGYVKFPSERIIPDINYIVDEISNIISNRKQTQYLYDYAVRMVNVFIEDFVRTMIMMIEKGEYKYIICDRGFISTFIYNILPIYLETNSSGNNYQHFLQLDPSILMQYFNNMSKLRVMNWFKKYITSPHRIFNQMNIFEDNKKDYYNLPGTLCDTFDVLRKTCDDFHYSLLNFFVLYNPDEISIISEKEEEGYKKQFDDNIVYQSYVNKGYMALANAFEFDIFKNEFGPTKFKFVKITDDNGNRRTVDDLADELIVSLMK